MSPVFLLPQHASRAAGLSLEVSRIQGHWIDSAGRPSILQSRWRCSANETPPIRSAEKGEARSRKGGKRRGKLACRTKSRPNGGTHSGEAGMGIGGRSTPLKGTPLRLCALATLRFCLFGFVQKQRIIEKTIVENISKHFRVKKERHLTQEQRKGNAKRELEIEPSVLFSAYRSSTRPCLHRRQTVFLERSDSNARPVMLPSVLAFQLPSVVIPPRLRLWRSGSRFPRR